MNFAEFKKYVDYCIEKKIASLKVEGVEIVFFPEVLEKEQTSVKIEELPVEDVAVTLKKKIDEEQKRHLQELFNV